MSLISSFPPCNLVIPNSWCRVTFQTRKYGMHCLLQRNKLDFISWEEKTSRRKTWRSFDMKCQSLGSTSVHYTQQEEKKKKLFISRRVDTSSLCPSAYFLPKVKLLCCAVLSISESRKWIMFYMFTVHAGVFWQVLLAWRIIAHSYSRLH